MQENTNLETNVSNNEGPKKTLPTFTYVFNVTMYVYISLIILGAITYPVYLMLLQFLGK